MSEIISAAVAALAEKLGDGDFEGSVKFEIEGEGAVRIDESGVAADDSDADCTLTATADVFQELMAGDINPTAAFMSGKLSVDGDMSMAMKLGAILT